MNLNQVTVLVTDIERAIEFYTQLGLNIIVHSPHYARFECPDGEATFSIHLTEELSKNSNATIQFECENLEEEVNRLKQLGLLSSEAKIQVQRWLWNEVPLNDPDGNKIILYYAGENRKNPPWRVKS